MLTSQIRNVTETVRTKAQTGVALAKAGILAPIRPSALPMIVRAAMTHRISPVTGWLIAVARAPENLAVVDEAGTLTYAELHRRTNALSNALLARGLRSGDGLAVMCRNHRGFPEALITGGKLGSRLLFLNTEFAEPQLRDVLAREEPAAVICDEEFLDLVHRAAPDLPAYVSWQDGSSSDGAEVVTVDELVAAASDEDPPAPTDVVRFVILTSGTTGTPKGAQRSSNGSTDTAAGIMAKIPYQYGSTAVIVPPVFHGWGFLNLGVQLALAGTVVLRRRFDPEKVLEDIQANRAETLVVVPVILKRLLDLDPEVRARYDTSSLQIIGSSGSALPGELSTKAMDAFGDVVYNLYGSTEVTAATIAGPADLRRAPGTAGSPPPGTIVKLLDEHDRVVDGTGPGAVGRIFVGSQSLFDGYTGGGSKEQVDGMMATGDVGYWDDHGCLHVSGRSDDMIVSGGENVFPREVEDLLTELDGVMEVAVIGVPDEEFGQRLRAFVVKAEGSDLDADAIRDHVKTNLARYKVPREVDFLDELPRNPTGKILRRVLAQGPEN